MCKRREFPKSVKLAAWQRSSGKCEECGAKLFPGKFHYDHTVPDALGGEPTLDNCKVLCAVDRQSCHSVKTHGATRDTKRYSDVSIIAKTKRLAKGPKETKAKLPGGKGSKWKKTLRGEWKLRDK